MQKPRIAIIGAGPGGLTLARILHVNGIPTTIFEKDAHRNSRQMAGGCLDLHPHSGQKALQLGDLTAQFKKHARYDGEDFILTDRFGEEHINLKDMDTGRPEIDRADLRAMLLDSLPDACIQWGHHLKRVDRDGTLQFEHTTETGFDLVIGADGAWSKVRQLVSTVPPFYSGIVGLEWWLDQPDLTHPELSAMLGNGSYFSFGDDDGRCLMSQRQGNRSIRTYAFLRKPEAWVTDCGVDWSDCLAVKEFLLDKEYAAWPAKLTGVISAWDGANPIIARPLYMLHVGVRWPHQRGFTLLGDAAHLMTPFAGEGANAAMWDAMELAKSILAHPGDLDAGVGAYEGKMFARSEKIQQMTWESTLRRFDRGGVEHFAGRINYLQEQRLKGEKVKDNGIGAEVTE